LPNIEIHGLAMDQASQLRCRIFQLLKDKSYIDETVVTVYPDVVEDKNGNSQPFIRVVNDCQAHTEEILKLLQSLGIDIEHMQLSSFIPKKQSK